MKWVPEICRCIPCACCWCSWGWSGQRGGKRIVLFGFGHAHIEYIQGHEHSTQTQSRTLSSNAYTYSRMARRYMSTLVFAYNETIDLTTHAHTHAHIHRIAHICIQAQRHSNLAVRTNKYICTQIANSHRKPWMRPKGISIYIYTWRIELAETGGCQRARPMLSCAPYSYCVHSLVRVQETQWHIV